MMMTRVNCKLTRIILGRHPAMSLTEAREKGAVCGGERQGGQGSSGPSPNHQGAECRKGQITV
jgi:hypothetical protein